MPFPHTRQLVLFAVLLSIMAATRFTHAAGAAALPDATWAVFFLGGFYLLRDWRWVLPSLFVVAVGADGFAIGRYGLSDYCATLSYWFIVPAYTVLWLAGAWLRKGYRGVHQDLARLLASIAAATTLCFAITHSAFYWLSGRIANPTLGEWGSAFLQWYPHFLGVTGFYVAAAALLHLALTQRPARATLAGQRQA